MEGIVVTNPASVVEEPRITSAVTTGPRPVELTTLDGSGGGNGSGASCPWSLTHKQQVHNLKENWKRALHWTGGQNNFGKKFETNPWFPRVVTEIRVDPYLDSWELEIDQSPLGQFLPGASMNSLDFLAILMGDLKMVQKILGSRSVPDDVIRGPIQDLSRDRKFLQATPIFDTRTMTGILFTPLHLAVAGGNSHIVGALLEKDADVNAQNWQGQTPLDLACKNGNFSMLDQLLTWDRKEKKGPFHVAVRLEEVDFVKRLPSGNVNAVDHQKTTPLHLAVEVGHSDMVGALLEKGADFNAVNGKGQTPLDLACRKRDVKMLEQLLAKDEEEKKKPIHVAVQHGDVELMKKLSSLNVNELDRKKRTPLHYLATQKFSSGQVADIVQYLAQDKALDMKALDDCNFSAFYVAVVECNTQFVIALLDNFSDQIRLNETCDEARGPPIQIAFEGGDEFRGIERILMECESIKGYMERLYRDRQVYVDAANAILVGAALIASVTFASWLQPPLNYTSYFGEVNSSSVLAPSTSNLNYVDVEHNIALRAFWVFNALSFYFAIGTVVYGARSVLPRGLFIKKTVEKLRTNLLVTAILLACAVLFVIIAFAIAGTIVLTPLLKYQWFMIVPTLVGGMVCIITLGCLVKSMCEIYIQHMRKQ